MWLGIVLHVSVIYTIEPTPIFWRDTQRTVWADVLMSGIHAFRMPAFFILAGFFAALLAATRGPEGLLRNRLARLALPFALFWPLVFSATVIAVLMFMNRLAFGEWSLNRAAIAPDLPQPKGLNTLHLWFLWMLLWFCVGVFLLMGLPRRWFAPFADALAWLGRQPWGVAILALPLLIAGSGYPRGFIIPSNAFLPPWNEWVHHGMFFIFGLMLYGRQVEFFDLFQRRWARFAIAGLIFYLACVMALRSDAPGLFAAYSFHCAGWLWSFACLGAALRFLHTRHALLGYLSESAYWVYLVHLPFTVFFGALLLQLPLSAVMKIVANIACTTAVCVGSYQLLVRHTWIGRLLNGKRQTRAGPAEVPQDSLNER